MKTRLNVFLAWLILAVGPLDSITRSQTPEVRTKPVVERNLSGPRFGMTILPGNSTLSKLFEFEGYGRAISQFGWHFEHRVIPSGGGPSLVVEWVPLIGGVEYGKFIPSLTLAVGIRFSNGFEFGMGPNILLAKAASDLVEDTFSTALVIAVGKAFDFGGVSIPVNLAYVTNPEGPRLGIIVGYAIER